MSNLLKQKPLPLKDRSEKPKKARKGMRAVSAKKAAERRSPEGVEGLDHMGKVKDNRCSACGCDGPNDAHHCRDMPPEHMAWIYERLPAAGRKSGATDTIPLCGPIQSGKGCHWLFHNNRSEFHRLYGFDYLHILPTRALVDAMNGEIDF